MTMAETQAADYRLGTPYATATATSTTRIALPTTMGPDDGHMWFAADTKDVWIRFGDGTVTVSASGVSTVVAEAITDAGSTVAHLYIPAGSEKQPKIPAGATHFAHISAATGGYLRFGPATGLGTPST